MGTRGFLTLFYFCTCLKISTMRSWKETRSYFIIRGPTLSGFFSVPMILGMPSFFTPYNIIKLLLPLFHFKTSKLLAVLLPPHSAPSFSPYSAPPYHMLSEAPDDPPRPSPGQQTMNGNTWVSASATLLPVLTYTTNLPPLQIRWKLRRASRQILSSYCCYFEKAKKSPPPPSQSLPMGITL